MNKIHVNWISFAAYKNHAFDFLKNVSSQEDQPPTFSFEHLPLVSPKSNLQQRAFIVLIILQPLEKKSHNWLPTNLKLQRQALTDLC